MCSDVEMQRPADLQAAMSPAHAFERQATMAESLTSSTTRSHSQASLPTSGGKAATPANSSTTSRASMTHSTFHRLSPEEMADKRKKGKCYFCPRKFTPDHTCATKGVFLMELSEDDDPFVLADDLGISLHALTGLSSANTIQLMVTIAGTEL
jgi:hypothetical protein